MQENIRSVGREHHYQLSRDAVRLEAGEISRTVTIAVLGDRLPEPTETFAVSYQRAHERDDRRRPGIGTILDNERHLRINNVSRLEGNAKTTNTPSFTVELSAAHDQTVTVHYATDNDTATAGTDYTSKTGSVTFAPGETIKIITVVIKGEKLKESNETFFVDLFGASSNAVIGVARGIGTFLDDDDGG